MQIIKSDAFSLAMPSHSKIEGAGFGDSFPGIPPFSTSSSCDLLVCTTHKSFFGVDEKNINIHVTEKLESRRTRHVKTCKVFQIEGRDQRRWRRGEGLREIKQTSSDFNRSSYGYETLNQSFTI